jgi:hypothetical protein
MLRLTTDRNANVRPDAHKISTARSGPFLVQRYQAATVGGSTQLTRPQKVRCKLTNAHQAAVKRVQYARRLIFEDRPGGSRYESKLTLIALNVVHYLAEITDKETGAAIVEVQTIADRICRSKPTVKRQIKRLVELGVVQRELRRKGCRWSASAYRLIDPASEKGDRESPFGSTAPPWDH